MAKGTVVSAEVFEKLAKTIGESKVKKIPSTPNKIIVKPKTTDDVSRIIKLAQKKKIPLVPKRDMDTGSKDSSSRGCIILNTENMNGVFEIDEENMAVTVGPGVLWKDLYGILTKRNYFIGAYPGSSQITVGEWVDIGGAGIGSYSYGFAGDLIRTMEVVLPDGKVINTGFKNVLPNSSGYNLNALFVGANTTLGIVSKVTLKMFPIPEEIMPMYYKFADQTAMTEAMRELTKIKTTPHNISFFDKNHLNTLRLFGIDVPQFEGMMMNVTLAGMKSVLEYEKDTIDALMEKHGATKEEQKTAQTLWDERFFGIAEKPTGVAPIQGEAVIPVSNLSEMINDTYSLLNKLQLKGSIKGIVGDRSTVFLTPYFLLDVKTSKRSRISITFSQKLGELALKHEGRPVGSGRTFAKILKQVYGEGINTILDIKSAIDPHDIMNPESLT